MTEEVTEVETPIEETIVTDTQETEQETPIEEETEQEEAEAEKPKKKSAVDRIKELTWEKHEARREADAIKAQFEALQRQIDSVNNNNIHQEQLYANDAPNPIYYEHGELDVNYIRDATRYELEQELIIKQKYQQEQTQYQSLAQKVETFIGKAKEVFDEPTRGFEAFMQYPKISPEFAELITTNEVGVQIADHLGSNLAELDRISGLPPALQGYELAKLEQSIKSTPKQIRTTNAPAPIPTLAGRAKIDVDPTKMSTEEWMKWRAESLKRK